MKRHPNANDYLICYPKAVHLWTQRLFHESVDAFVHSPAQIILGNEEKKAAYIACERQKTVANSVAAKSHEEVTDEMCKELHRTEDKRDTTEWKELCNKAHARRAEWQNLFGVFNKEQKKRMQAIRLKTFVRIMSMIEKP